MVERLVDADVIELQVRVTRTASSSISSLSPYHHPHDTTIPPIDMSKATEKHIYLTRHAEAEHKYAIDYRPHSICRGIDEDPSIAYRRIGLVRVLPHKAKLNSSSNWSLQSTTPRSLFAAASKPHN